MKTIALSLTFFLMTALIVGCPSPGDTPEAKGNETAKTSTKRSQKTKTPPKIGELHYRDTRKPVTLFVLHDPKLDLGVQCRLLQERLKAEGKDEPLCFEAPEADSTPNSIRVEHHEGMKIGEALAALRAKGEGAHFIVAQGGSVYQVLDLSLSPRRDGAYQPGEIRILSGELKGHKKLIGAIHDVFPNLKVSKVAAEPPKRQPKKTAHDKARAPEKHTDDEVHKTPKPASKTDHHDDEHHP